MTADEILDGLAELLRDRLAEAETEDEGEDADEGEEARAGDDDGGPTLTLRDAQALSHYLRLDIEQRGRLNRWLRAHGRC
jgi:hypothetical protein